jgi:hypothetical protein
MKATYLGGLSFILALAICAWTPDIGRCAGPSPGSMPVSFINDVAPILKDNCFACHDAKKRKGKLDLTSYEGVRKGGTKDDPIVAGKPEESLLIELVRGKDTLRMPPRDTGDPLSSEKIAVLERWIKEGAALDPGVSPKADLMAELRARWVPPLPPAAYKYPVNVTAMAFTPDKRRLIVGGYFELTVWDAAEGRLERRLNTRAERAYGMVFLPDGMLAVAGGRPGQAGDVCIYNPTAPPTRFENGMGFLDGVSDPKVLIKQLADTDDAILCVAASADGKKLAAGGCDRIVRVWDFEKGYADARLEQSIENHADWVLGVAFSADGKHILTASRDKTAKVWDLASKESVLTFPDHQNGVYGVAVKPDGKVGVSVGEDSQVRFWNATGDGKQIRTLRGHGGTITRVIYDPSQPLVFTSSADNTVRVWNADTGAAVRTLAGNSDWVFGLALSPQGDLVASGSWNGEVRIWKVVDGSLIKSFNASPGLLPAVTQAAARK